MSTRPTTKRTVHFVLPDLGSLSLIDLRGAPNPASTDVYRHSKAYDPGDPKDVRFAEKEERVDRLAGMVDRAEHQQGIGLKRQRSWHEQPVVLLTAEPGATAEELSEVRVYNQTQHMKRYRELIDSRATPASHMKRLRQLESTVQNRAVPHGSSDADRTAYLWDKQRLEMDYNIKEPQTKFPMIDVQWAQWFQIRYEADYVTEGLRVMERYLQRWGDSISGARPPSGQECTSGSFWWCVDVVQTLVASKVATKYAFNRPYLQQPWFNPLEDQNYKRNEANLQLYKVMVPPGSHRDFGTILDSLVADANTMEWWRMSKYKQLGPLAADLRLVLVNVMIFELRESDAYREALHMLTGKLPGTTTNNDCLDRTLNRIQYEEYDAARAVERPAWSELLPSGTYHPRVRWLTVEDYAQQLIIEFLSHPCTIRALSPQYLTHGPGEENAFNVVFKKRGALSLVQLRELVPHGHNALIETGAEIKKLIDAAAAWYKSRVDPPRPAQSRVYFPYKKRLDFLDVLDRCFISGWKPARGPAAISVQSGDVPSRLLTLQRCNTAPISRFTKEQQYKQDVVRQAFRQLTVVQRDALVKFLLHRFPRDFGDVEFALGHHTIDLDQVPPELMRYALDILGITKDPMTWPPYHHEMDDGVATRSFVMPKFTIVNQYPVIPGLSREDVERLSVETAYAVNTQVYAQGDAMDKWLKWRPWDRDILELKVDESDASGWDDPLVERP